MNNIYSAQRASTVIDLDAESRGRFVSRTYAHLFCAILTFTLIEVSLFQSGLAATMAKAMLGVSWLWILGGFMLVSWLATRAAHLADSKAVQYAALAGYVAAQAI